MALNITRLKEKIKKAWTEEMENENENDYLDKVSQKIASAVIEEIKQVSITATDDLPAGAEIKLPDSVNKDSDVLNYYSAKRLQPATAVILPPEEERLEGIGYWVIQTDFKVS